MFLKKKVGRRGEDGALGGEPSAASPGPWTRLEPRRPTGVPKACGRDRVQGPRLGPGLRGALHGGGPGSGLKPLGPFAAPWSSASGAPRAFLPSARGCGKCWVQLVGRPLGRQRESQRLRFWSASCGRAGSGDWALTSGCPALAAAGSWGTNQWMEDLSACLCLFQTHQLRAGLCLSGPVGSLVPRAGPGCAVGD